MSIEGAAGVVSLLGLFAGCRFRRRIEREMCRRRGSVFYVQVRRLFYISLFDNIVVFSRIKIWKL